MQSAWKLLGALLLVFLFLMIAQISGILASQVALVPHELRALTQPRSLETDDDKPKTRDLLELWDTGQPSAKPLSASDLDSKTGWKRIPSSEKHDSFQGDAVITNGRILAVLRRQSPAVEIYSASNLKVGLEDSTHPAGLARLRLHLLKSDKEAA